MYISNLRIGYIHSFSNFCERTFQKEHIAVKHIVKENNRGTLNWKLPQSEIKP